MATDNALIEKRKELKRRLLAGGYKTLVDVFLEWFDRLIRKLTKRSEPYPLWLITIFLCGINLLITFGTGYLIGDLTEIRNKLSSLGAGARFDLIFLLLAVLPITSIIVINQAIRRIYVLWQEYMIDATETVTSLQKFEGWLAFACNRQLHFFIALISGLVTFIIMVLVARNILGFPPSYGVMVAFFVGNMTGSLLYPQLLNILFLPGMLRQYDLKLFVADPATSELLSHLSSELGFFVTFIAFYATFVTLLLVVTGLYLQFSLIFLVLFFWLAMIVVFTLNQSGLSSLVRQAKWKTLNDIQVKVEALQAADGFESKEIMDAVNRLLDYHERVNKTRSSALDLRAYLNFINSLLLPLLAFIFGNFNLVKSIFTRQP